MTDAEKVLLCSKVEEAMFLNWPETDVEAVGVCQKLCKQDSLMQQ